MNKRREELAERLAAFLYSFRSQEVMQIVQGPITVNSRDGKKKMGTGYISGKLWKSLQIDQPWYKLDQETKNKYLREADRIIYTASSTCSGSTFQRRRYP
jgi:hypothetical protein